MDKAAVPSATSRAQVVNPRALKLLESSGVAAAIVESYEKLVSSFRRGDLDDCLRTAGLFVEHALRAVEFIRTGSAPPEIKSVAGIVKVIEGDATLSEPLRYLVPRVAQMAIYEVRSKRGEIGRAHV